jgi:hypothetical protein
VKAALLALVLAGCATAPARPPEAPGEVLFADEVLQGMFEIQRVYRVETIRCLTGFVAGDTIHVAGMTPTWIDFQNDRAVRFRPCTAPGTVGWYHNHPPMLGPGGPLIYCEPSSGDVGTTRGLTNLWVAALTCSEWTLVWWFKGGGDLHQETFPPYVYSIATGEETH